MILNQVELNSVNQIVRSQGLSRLGARHFTSWLNDSANNHGMNWLVVRLKDAVSALLSDDMTKFRRDNGLMKGPFRQIHKLFLRSRRGRQAALRILKIYGRWEAKPADREDFKRFSKSVDPQTEISEEHLTMHISPTELRVGARIARRAQFSTSLPSSNSKVVPFTKRVEADVSASDHYELLNDYCPNLLGKHRPIFESQFRINEFDDRSYGLSYGENPMDADVAGKVICLTKDRGMKHRFIANPHRLIQTALSRLQSASANYLKSLPESLVFDQPMAEDWVVQQLGAGKHIWSLDLSAATDHFPLDLQVNTICKLFPDLSSDIALWGDVSRLLWETPFEDVDIKYTRGQPMGTAPSFAVFTLTHVLLVRSLGGNASNFRVIGDDIIITDKGLAQRYMRKMSNLKVVINMTKSLLNKPFAEFAGRLIDEHGIYHVYKASPLDVKKDPLGYLRQYGHSSLKLIPKKVRDKIYFLSLIPGISNLRNCIDPNFLDHVDSQDFSELVGWEEYLPYEFDETRKTSLAYAKPPTQFEEANSREGFGSSFSKLRNNKQVVEHINSNEELHNSSELLDSLSNSLSRGCGTPGYEEVGVKFPISYVTKVYKKLYTQLD